MSLVERIWRRAPPMVERMAVSVLPARYGNLLQCSRSGLWNGYFADAEPLMSREWDDLVWPLIHDFDFRVVLELAPGAGRNTHRLAAVARAIHLVEYNEYALDQCRRRFGPQVGGCTLRYHVNNGRDLGMLVDRSVSAIYCWDAAVHFDRSVLGGYIGEFGRVLAPGGRGLVHHSDLGDRASKDIKRNPHWRSNASRALVAAMCEASGLNVAAQVAIPWGDASHRHGRVIDCATVFTRPA